VCAATAAGVAESGGAARVVARADGEIVPPETFVEPRPVSWDSAEGQAVHGLLYVPHGATTHGETRPPLIVNVHGGPTSQSTASSTARAQFFVTRGYAFLDLTIAAAPAYGRTYRNLLREQWGLIDVDDAVTGARYVAESGLADADRLVIMGGSAGGYAVLQALVRYPGVFRAGICMYGVSNLFDLAADTHKFEQHYLDSMIGPLPATAERYRERSPIYHADRIRDAVAVFQGVEDRVVPQAQAEMIVAALKRNGVPHEYHLYAGEGHGWRKSETIETFYTAVLRFLQQYVLFG
jgi:dipeptidyl aminopeptidase/acylaminoacyl peptidase